jgi:hypothetical protein
MKKKKSTRRGKEAKRAQVARPPGQATPPMLVGASSLRCRPSSSPDAQLDLKTPIYIPPWTIAIGGGGETWNIETEAVPSKIGGGKCCRSRPLMLLHPLRCQHHHHRHEEGVVHLWTMGLWQYVILFLSYASIFRHHMSCPTWLWCILCNSYVVDLYIIGWLMRCDMLLCSWCMSRCILLPHSLLLVLIQHVCESERGIVCIKWSN